MNFLLSFLIYLSIYLFNFALDTVELKLINSQTLSILFHFPYSFILLIICIINLFTSEKYLSLPSTPYPVSSQNNRKKLVPSPLRRKQFKRFFDCAGKLMESQLLTACKCSLRDFVNYVANGKVNIHTYLPSAIDRREIISRRGNTHAFRSFLFPLPLSRSIGTHFETQFPSISAYQSFSRLVHLESRP